MKTLTSVILITMILHDSIIELTLGMRPLEPPGEGEATIKKLDLIINNVSCKKGSNAAENNENPRQASIQHNRRRVRRNQPPYAGVERYGIRPVYQNGHDRPIAQPISNSLEGHRMIVAQRTTHEPIVDPRTSYYIPPIEHLQSSLPEEVAGGNVRVFLTPNESAEQTSTSDPPSLPQYQYRSEENPGSSDSQTPRIQSSQNPSTTSRNQTRSNQDFIPNRPQTSRPPRSPRSPRSSRPPRPPRPPRSPQTPQTPRSDDW